MKLVFKQEEEGVLVCGWGLSRVEDMSEPQWDKVAAQINGGCVRTQVQ